MKKLVAVVPIRKGSQRVKNKNFREFSGENLLIHKINLLKKLNGIDDIIINTDSDDAISISKKMDVSFFKEKIILQVLNVKTLTSGKILPKQQKVNL